MHVALVSAEYPPTWGGIGSFTFFFSKYLIREGVDVTVITRSQQGQIPDNPGVKVIAIPDGLCKLFSPRIFGKRAIAYIGENNDFDIIHFAYPLLAISHSELSAISKPTVATMHGTWYGEQKAIKKSNLTELSFNDLTVKVFYRLLMRYEQIAINHCTAITTVSDYCAQELTSHYSCPAHKLTVIGNGVDVTLFRPNHQARGMLLDTHNLPPQACLILFAGRLVARKGLPDLLNAFKRCHSQGTGELYLLIVGDGPLKPKIKRMAASMNLSERVIVESGLSPDELALRYAGSDFFVLPSLYEGFGLVYLEAMASQKPVIGIMAGGVPQVIEDTIDGYLCQPNNPMDLADKMLLLINNSQKKHSIGRKGYQKVMNNYTWEIITRKFLSLYTGCLKE